MLLPTYWLPRPAIPFDSDTQQAFDDLYEQFVAQPQPGPILYTLPAPKWQFLCYLSEHHNLVLHGSGNPEITRFEPRQSNDLSAFGNQTAVYAAADGIWAMFFVIVDRDRYDMSVNNACIRIMGQPAQGSEPYYFFSISQTAFPKAPWRTGTVYVLPRASFSPQPPLHLEGVEIQTAQVVSLVPVDALARLVVGPDDFPFLKQIRAHDDSRLAEYAQAMQTGAPWPDDQLS